MTTPERIRPGVPPEESSYRIRVVEPGEAHGYHVVRVDGRVTAWAPTATAAAELVRADRDLIRRLARGTDFIPPLHAITDTSGPDGGPARVPYR